MENELVYYTPKPEEMHLGKEFEVREWVDSPKGLIEEWIPMIWGEYDCISDVKILFEFDDIRCKYEA